MAITKINFTNTSYGADLCTEVKEALSTHASDYFESVEIEDNTAVKLAHSSGSYITIGLESAGAKIAFKRSDSTSVFETNTFLPTYLIATSCGIVLGNKTDANKTLFVTKDNTAITVCTLNETIISNSTGLHSASMDNISAITNISFTVNPNYPLTSFAPHICSSVAERYCPNLFEMHTIQRAGLEPLAIYESGNVKYVTSAGAALKE